MSAASRLSSLIKLKPTTPGQRHAVLLNKKNLYKGSPVSYLSFGMKKTGGRNNKGHITVNHRGGGHKRKYRIIDFHRSDADVWNQRTTVEELEYDPNRTSFIARLLLPSGKFRYIIAPQGISKGDTLVAGDDPDIKPGNCLKLANVPVGQFVHNIELYPGKGAQIVRSAGTSAQVLGKDVKSGKAMLRLMSGEQRLLSLRCLATIGTVSNPDNKNVKIGKAGRNRWLGKRPSVRGVAMNPVDHPHGGGEGKTSGGRPSVTPWGIITKGKKTRRPTKTTNKYIVVNRHRAKKI